MSEIHRDQWRAVKAENIKIVVADEEWQEIREAFVGTWKKPGVADRNLQTLEEYVRPFSNPWKVRRVLNYLTGSGFRTGQITDAFGPETQARYETLLGEVRHHWREMTEEVAA